MDSTRCAWVSKDPLYIAYHDQEWGVPVHDDRRLFEMLNLGGAQAGLSWLTILKRREGYRSAFDGFDPEAIARYGPKHLARLLGDAGIIRNRRKIEATVTNAKAYLKLREEGGSLDAFVWGVVGSRPRQNMWKAIAEVPAVTEESVQMSKALSKRGFNFVGPTICYAFMQAVGLVNDHTTDCFRHTEVSRLSDGSGSRRRKRR